MNKILFKQIIFALLLMLGALSSKAEEKVDFSSLKCVVPSIASYWQKDSNVSEVVVIYSVEGLAQDLKERLPAETFGVFMEASKFALQKYPVKKYGIGIQAETNQFVEKLRELLSASAGLPADACGPQTQEALEMINAIYFYRSRNPSVGLAKTLALSENNVTTIQLLSLIGNAEPGTSSECKAVYTTTDGIVRICK